MATKNLCEIVRDEFAHDREFCLYPLRHHDGLTQACTVSFPYGININLRFFDEKYNIQVWVGDKIINYYPGNVIKVCFFIRDFMRHLLENSREAALLFIYSLHFTALRKIKAAADVAAADDADVAYVAAVADVAAADDAAADDAAVAAADDAAAAADDAAAYVVAAVAADDAADAYKHMKIAFKHLIKYRKRVKRNL